MKQRRWRKGGANHMDASRQQASGGAYRSPRPAAAPARKTAHQNILRRAKEKIAGLVARVRANKAHREQVDLFPVSAQEVAEAKRHNLDIEGFVHMIDSSAVNHVIKNHGDVQSEKNRGNIAITDRDFVAIVEVLDNPDQVVYGGNNETGRDTVVSIKSMRDGSTVVITEVRTGKKKLALNSMRRYPSNVPLASILKGIKGKREATGTAHAVQQSEPLSPTSETLPSGRLSIVEKPQPRNFASQQPKQSFSLQGNKQSKQRHNPESVKAGIAEAMGAGWLEAMQRGGLLEVISSRQARQIAGRVEKGWLPLAFYSTKARKTYIVADNISTDHDLKGLMLHEIGIHAMQAGRTNKQWQALLQRAKAMRRMGNEKMQAAFAKAEQRGTESHLLAEEALGYFVEDNPDLSFSQRVIAALRELIRTLASKFKGADRIRFVRWANALTDADIVLMASRATKQAAVEGDALVSSWGEALLLSSDESLEQINNRFNQELGQFVAGELGHDHVFEIGKAGAILRSTGFPDLPIELKASKLSEKANAFWHRFAPEGLVDLPKALNDPLAVFAYGDKSKSQNVIIELESGGKKFLIGVHFSYDKEGVFINDIRGIFPKDNAEWLNWITQKDRDGSSKLLYADKKRVQGLINQRRTNLAEVEYLDLDSVERILDGFENVKVLDGDDALKHSLIGQRGARRLDSAEEKTHRLDNLQVAREMEAADKDAKIIRLATGWERGADGKWRYEVEDSQATVLSKEALLEMASKDPYNAIETTVDKVVQFDELFNAYPALREIGVFFDGDTTDGGFGGGAFDPAGNVISFGAGIEPNLIKSLLLHELQHGVQREEGFASGGSMHTIAQAKQAVNNIERKLRETDVAFGFADWLGKNIDVVDAVGGDMTKLRQRFMQTLPALDAQKYNNEIVKAEHAISQSYKKAGITSKQRNLDDYEAYLRLAGEVEARNVETRMDMSAQERRETLIRDTEDVAREDQIFLRADSDMQFGLPMDFESRMERAEAMGFDTDTLYTHNSPEKEIERILPEGVSGRLNSFYGLFALRGSEGAYHKHAHQYLIKGEPATDEDLAAYYEENPEKTKKIFEPYAHFEATEEGIEAAIESFIYSENISDESGDIYKSLMSADYPSAFVDSQNFRARLAAQAGFNAVEVFDEFGGEAVMLLPGNGVRNINAAFDPEQGQKDNLKFSLAPKDSLSPEQEAEIERVRGLGEFERQIAVRGIENAGMLAAFVDDESHRVRQSVTHNDSATADVLAMFVNDENRGVRSGIAKNPNTTPEIMRQLDVETVQIGRSLAGRDDLPIDLARRIYKVNDNIIRNVMNKNTRIPDDVAFLRSEDGVLNAARNSSDLKLLDWLIDKGSPDINAALIENPNLRESAAPFVLNGMRAEDRDPILGRTKSKPVLEAFVRYAEKKQLSNSSLFILAGNEALTDEQFGRVFLQGESAALDKMFDVKEGTLLRILELGTKKAVSAVAGYRGITEKVALAALTKLQKNPDSNIKEIAALLESGKIPVASIKDAAYQGVMRWRRELRPVREVVDAGETRITAIAQKSGLGRERLNVLLNRAFGEERVKEWRSKNRVDAEAVTQGMDSPEYQMLAMARREGAQSIAGHDHAISFFRDDLSEDFDALYKTQVASGHPPGFGFVLTRMFEDADGQQAAVITEVQSDVMSVLFDKDKDSAARQMLGDKLAAAREKLRSVRKTWPKALLRNAMRQLYDKGIQRIYAITPESMRDDLGASPPESVVNAWAGEKEARAEGFGNEVELDIEGKTVKAWDAIGKDSEAAQGIRFSRTSKKAAQASKADVEAAILRAVGAKNAQHIHVVTAAELRRPDGARDLLSGKGTVEGFYDPDSGMITIVADSVDQRSAVLVAWHELGHRGIDVAGFGQFKSLLENADKNPTMRELADKIMASRGKEDEASTNRLVALEEAAVELYAAMKSGDWAAIESKYDIKIPQALRPASGFVARLMSRIKTILAKVLGADTVSDAAVFSLLNRVDLAVRQEFVDTATLYGGKAAWQKAKETGKTKLDYRQWVQVRTPAFKKWFGDWQAAFAAKPKRAARTLAEARSKAGAFAGRPLQNLSTGFVGRVSNANLMKMSQEKATSKSNSMVDHILAIANLDWLFVHAELDHSHPDERNEPTIRAIHRYVAPMHGVDGHVLAVKITVKETTSDKNPNPIYSIETIEIGSPPSVLLTHANPDGTGIRPQADFSKNILQKLEEVKAWDATKITDPDTGEPHATAVDDFEAEIGAGRIRFSRKTDGATWQTTNQDRNRILREQDKTLFEKGKKWLRRYLAPGGLLPKVVFGAKIERDSQFEAIEFDVKNLIGRLENAIRQDFNLRAEKLDEKTNELLSDVMSGKPLENGVLPDATLEALAGMRSYIDNISVQYMNVLADKIGDLHKRAEATNSARDYAALMNEAALLKRPHMAWALGCEQFTAGSSQGGLCTM